MMSIFRLFAIQLLLSATTGAFQTPSCTGDALTSIRLGTTTALLATRKPTSVTHQRGAARNANNNRRKAKSRTSHKLSSISTADIVSYDLHDFIEESKRWKPTMSKSYQDETSKVKRGSKEAERSHTIFVGNLSYGECHFHQLIQQVPVTVDSNPNLFYSPPLCHPSQLRDLITQISLPHRLRISLIVLAKFNQCQFP